MRSPAPRRFAQTRELSSSGVLLDRIAAVVNEGVVLVSRLDAQTDEIIQRLRQQKTELPPRNVLRKQILERLIVEEIQMQRADRIGIEVSEEMLNGALDDVAKRNNIPFPDLPRALAQQGIDYRDFRDEIRRQMTLQLLRQRDVIGRINISPRELEQFMARQQNAPDQNAEYNISHILISVPVTASPEQIESREQRAREVYDKAKGGEDFAQLAVGVLGKQHQHRRRLARLAPRAAAAVDHRGHRVQQMKAGEVSEPIRTPSGFHLFRLNEIRGGAQQAVVAQVHARHILLKTNELEDDQTVEQKLAAFASACSNGGEDFARDRRGDVAGSELRRRRRRSRLGGPRARSCRSSSSSSTPSGKRDQPAVQDAIRLAHRPAARPPPARRHRRRDPPSLRFASCASPSGGRDRAVAAPAARRGVRRIQDVMPPPRLIRDLRRAGRHRAGPLYRHRRSRVAL